MSFKAVQVAGDLGGALAEESTSFAYGSSLCRAVMVTSPGFALAKPGAAPGGPKTCDQLAAAEEGWSKVIDSLALYGDSLSALASRDDADFSAQAQGLQAALASAGVAAAASEKAQAATSAASALVGLLFDEMRRGELKTRIEEANPHVQKMVEGLHVHIVAELSVLRALRAELALQREDFLKQKVIADCEVEVESSGTTASGGGAPAPGPSAHCSWDSEEIRTSAITLAYAQEGWLIERERDLTETKQALLAFAEAHQVLKDNAGSLGVEDAEHLVKIGSALKGVYDEAAVALKEDK